MSKALERYHAAAHAMQSGVAAKMNIDPKETEPKHLRVGVNAAMCDTSGLARLLVEKGVITLPEHEKAIADEMEREKTRYAQFLREHLGPTVHLA